MLRHRVERRGPQVTDCVRRIPVEGGMHLEFGRLEIDETRVALLHGEVA